MKWWPRYSSPINTLTRLLRVLGQVKGFFIIGFPREMTQANLFEERVRLRRRLRRRQKRPPLAAAL